MGRITAPTVLSITFTYSGEESGEIGDRGLNALTALQFKFEGLYLSMDFSKIAAKKREQPPIDPIEIFHKAKISDPNIG